MKKSESSDVIVALFNPVVLFNLDLKPYVIIFFWIPLCLHRIHRPIQKNNNTFDYPINNFVFLHFDSNLFPVSNDLGAFFFGVNVL